MAIIQTTNLTKRYKKFTALSDVSISVERGDIYGLIGKNGAGKTTFFKLIMGLSSSTSGTIELDLAQVGFMIGTAFFPYLTGRQNLEYYRTLKGIATKDNKTGQNEVERVLKLVGLSGENKPFRAYSLGMKQRLGIANALLGRPPIVILDEPINGLDPEGVMDIRKMIKSVNKEDSTTFIVSSHILSELDLVATKFGFIDHGVLLQEITHKDLHKSTQKSLIITVDDADKAVQILEKKFGLTDYEVVESAQSVQSAKTAKVAKTAEIILKEHLDKSSEIATTLVDAKIKLYELKKQETSLEDYFFNLIGGKTPVEGAK